MSEQYEIYYKRDTDERIEVLGYMDSDGYMWFRNTRGFGLMSTNAFKYKLEPMSDSMRELLDALDVKSVRFKDRSDWSREIVKVLHAEDWSAVADYVEALIEYDKETDYCPHCGTRTLFRARDESSEHKNL